MPDHYKNKQKGVSGYGKSKKKTLKELDEAMDITPKSNPIDRVQDQLNHENEESKGITDRIRNIFD